MTAAPVESRPPGDIPDSVAYVSYTNPVAHYTFVHPEGWAETQHGSSVRFSDKLNGIYANSSSAPSAPTIASAKSGDIPSLRSGQPAFQLEQVKAVTLPGGTGVLIVYRRNSSPDPVTGKVYRDEVQRYEVFSSGRVVDLELYGPVGADNVDPYAKISQSLRLG